MALAIREDYVPQISCEKARDYCIFFSNLSMVNSGRNLSKNEKKPVNIKKTLDPLHQEFKVNIG